MAAHPISDLCPLSPLPRSQSSLFDFVFRSGIGFVSFPFLWVFFSPHSLVEEGMVDGWWRWRGRERDRRHPPHPLPLSWRHVDPWEGDGERQRHGRGCDVGERERQRHGRHTERERGDLVSIVPMFPLSFVRSNSIRKKKKHYEWKGRIGRKPNRRNGRRRRGGEKFLFSFVFLFPSFIRWETKKKKRNEETSSSQEKKERIRMATGKKGSFHACVSFSLR